MRGTTGDIRLDLFIMANSPGEISGWVLPLIRDLRVKSGHIRITILIPPCQYSSGEELELGRVIGADRCVKLGDLNNMISESVGAASKRLLLHIGGDTAFSVYASKKLKCPLWVYASKPRWNFFVQRYFVSDEKYRERFEKKSIPSGKFRVIGNMALDSAVLSETETETREFLGAGPDTPVLTCLAGSRPFEYRGGIPLFARIARMITDKFPDMKVVFPLAQTVREDLLKSALAEAGIGWTGESRVRAIDIGCGRTAMVVRDRTLEVLNCSRLALAIPGTNNLQAAALYIPFIMICPLDRVDEFPLDGLPGLLPLKLPGFRRFKRRYIERLNEKMPCLSLPNIMAGRMIAPEIRGRFNAEVVANMAAALLESPERLKEISRAFWELTRDRGAAARLAEEIVDFSQKT